MRWERETHDAALDDAVVAGESCPVCGDASTEGKGPCSEACEQAYVSCAQADGNEDRRDFADECAAEEIEEKEAAWMAGNR